MSDLISVADALALAEVQAGDPELIAGAQGLDREIRWAHVVAGSAAVGLLDGGELVLTTGAGWPREGDELARLSAALIDTGPAAVVIELGRFFTEPPAPLRAVCEEHGIPLIALHHEVRFVQITQRVHQRILAAQTEALAARAEVHAMLTELGLNRSPVDYVIERLADTLGTAVVLEDSSRRVVAWAGRADGTGTGTEGGSPAAGIPHPLAPWADADGADFTPLDGWERVPVEAQGRRWGRLIALPGPEHPAGRRTVLELGAFALALGRLADPEGGQWLQLSSKHLFDVLLGGRYRRDEELAVQLAAAGLPVSGRLLIGATLRGVGDFGGDASLEHAMLATALRRAVGQQGRVILAHDDASDDAAATTRRRGAALIALLSFPPDDARLHGAEGSAPPLASRLAHELDALLPSTVPAAWRAHLGLGSAGRRVRGLISSLEQVRAAGELEPAGGTGRVTVQQAERQPLAYLVRGLAALPEVQEFAAETLGPIIEHDATSGAGHSGDLLRVLRAYLEHPTNRSLAAQRARLSRSVFYQRLALIEELLGVDLTNGTVIATLTVALLARR
ncbi:PucR family transcriptional regulator [Leucobacter chironomi]|uniref:PucR family transcriptional regulator n=1 Tax=Leucobacter chironomi TaxID=491918 RepID=UPI000462C2A6|nr:PucR family transcriptional regulator [Leucobacter chironomi]